MEKEDVNKNYHDCVTFIDIFHTFIVIFHTFIDIFSKLMDTNG